LKVSDILISPTRWFENGNCDGEPPLKRGLNGLDVRWMGTVIIFGFVMAKMIGYMLTWTTYGSWLQGDKRGYAKDGQILSGSEALEKANRQSRQGKLVELTQSQCDIVRATICKEAEKIGQKIYAISVCKNHVHLVVDRVGKTVESSAAIYKSATSKALREKGIEGRVWTNGYDKRFCFDKETLQNRIGYVQKHG